jgi:hypothetical protein
VNRAAVAALSRWQRCLPKWVRFKWRFVEYKEQIGFVIAISTWPLGVTSQRRRIELGESSPASTASKFAFDKSLACVILVKFA